MHLLYGLRRLLRLLHDPFSWQCGQVYWLCGNESHGLGSGAVASGADGKQLWLDGKERTAGQLGE